MKADDLIVELARSASPVAPLTSPSVRFTRWAAAMVVVAGAGVLLWGPRADITEALRRPVYEARLVVTLMTALLAAAAAFVLSVPGAERSPVQRMLPFVAVGAWAALLVSLLVAGGDPVARVLAFPVNWPCSYKIFGFCLIPGIALVGAASARSAAPTCLERSTGNARGDRAGRDGHAVHLSGRRSGPPTRRSCAAGARSRRSRHDRGLPIAGMAGHTALGSRFVSSLDFQLTDRSHFDAPLASRRDL